MAATRRPDRKHGLRLVLLMWLLTGVVWGQIAVPAQDPVIAHEVVPSDQLPSKLRSKGKVIYAVKWEDRANQHLLTFALQEKGEFGSKGYLSLLTATEYLVTGNRLKPLWVSAGRNSHCLEAVELDSAAVQVTDLDGDGRSESWWGFLIAPDGLDPQVACLEMHIGKRDYDILGQFAGYELEVGQVETMTVNQKFLDIDARFEQYATKKWAEMQQRFYDSWQ